MVLSDRAAEAWFQRRVHNQLFSIYFPDGEIFQASDKKGRKMFITSKKENPFLSGVLYTCMHALPQN